MTLSFPHRTSPNEATIESLTNHSLLATLRILGVHSAWVYKPTQREEKLLGYDGAVQGTRYGAAIQYKRISPNSDGSCTVRIDWDQHRTLTKNFPRRHNPYIFYAFSLCPDYEGIDCCFQVGDIIAPFLKTCVFIDAHDLTLNDTQKTSGIKFPLDKTSTSHDIYSIHPINKVVSIDSEIAATRGHVFTAAIKKGEIGITLVGDAGTSIVIDDSITVLFFDLER